MLPIGKLHNSLKRSKVRPLDGICEVQGRTLKAFTLVELLAAVAVIAVGMVFVLGAFNQCLGTLTTSHKTIAACGLLNAKAWEIDAAFKENNGSEEGEWSGEFEPPNEGFNWTHVVRASSQDFGNETLPVQENVNEDIIKVSWKQGSSVKDVVVTRFVKRKKE